MFKILKKVLCWAERICATTRFIRAIQRNIMVGWLGLFYFCPSPNHLACECRGIDQDLWAADPMPIHSVSGNQRRPWIAAVCAAPEQKSSKKSPTYQTHHPFRGKSMSFLCHSMSRDYAGESFCCLLYLLLCLFFFFLKEGEQFSSHWMVMVFQKGLKRL